MCIRDRRKVKRKASEAEVDESMLGEELHAQPDDDDEEKVHLSLIHI